MEVFDPDSSTLISRMMFHPSEDQESQCYINSLPSELICKVFNLLKDVRVKYITPCLAVSKQWHIYGRAIMWSSLVLTELTYDSFAYSLAFGGSSYHGLLNLTVCLQVPFETRCLCVPRWEEQFGCEWGELRHPWEFHPLDENTVCSFWGHVDIHFDRQQLQESLQRKLEQILVSMKNAIASGLRMLLTLSLTIRNEPPDGEYCYCHETVLGPKYFANIIKALPTACVDLELDTGGVDRQHSIPRPHDHAHNYYTDHDQLCDALHTILPQLRNLRLRVAELCPDFFYGPHQTLPLHLEASACQTWASVCEVGVHYGVSVSETLDLGANFNGPTGDLEDWQEWLGLPDSERRVSLSLPAFGGAKISYRSGK